MGFIFHPREPRPRSPPQGSGCDGHGGIATAEELKHVPGPFLRCEEGILLAGAWGLAPPVLFTYLFLKNFNLKKIFKNVYFSLCIPAAV